MKASETVADLEMQLERYGARLGELGAQETRLKNELFQKAKNLDKYGEAIDDLSFRFGEVRKSLNHLKLVYRCILIFILLVVLPTVFELGAAHGCHQ